LLVELITTKMWSCSLHDAACCLTLQKLDVYFSEFLHVITVLLFMTIELKMCHTIGRAILSDE